MKDLLSISDLSKQQVLEILDLSKKLKASTYQSVLSQRSLAMIFEKPSLRTRCTFETGMVQLGGHALYLQPSDIKLGQRETISDVAKNLERWVDVIMARTFLHSSIIELAENCSIPVINALSDLEHPCQALADFFTIFEHRKKVSGLKIVFIGDGNNVCHSLMLLSAIVGSDFTLACPPGYEPEESIVEETKAIMSKNGNTFTIFNNVKEASVEADVLYTDVWISMGQEEETKHRKKIFEPYQINSELIGLANKDVLVMHCLPAHRGEEITADAIDGANSVVFDQAENRMHVQKAIILKLLNKDNNIT